ncbi:MAG: helix-turn-helix domain-containing protein [Roseburia sp.]
MMNFAEKLLELRTRYGYSQEGLAEKLGVSRQAVSKWELGTTLPETDKVIAISNFFGVSTDYLLKKSARINSTESLDRVILKFLSSAQDMENVSKELIDIMADGVIDEGEQERMDMILMRLDSISSTIEDIKRRVRH